MRTCWDCHWKERVRHNGSMSTCRTRHVGAVAVRDRRVVGDGFNGNLPGHSHCDEGGCPRCAEPLIVTGQKLDQCFCVHAETNLVSYAAKAGVSLAGVAVYVSCTPCLECFKLLASSGVTEIVYGERYAASEETVRRLAKISGISLRFYHCQCEGSG